MHQTKPLQPERGVVDGPRHQRLFGVEACRGLAALAVLFYHASRHVERNSIPENLAWVFKFGHAGVDLFFVISGFIIAYVHYEDIDQPGRFPRYAARRFTRIFPIYWVALCFTVMLGLMGSRHVEAFRVFWSATLLPSRFEPVLGVAWTLQYELVFYVFFSVLILRRSAGLLVFAAWLCWLVAANLSPHAVGAIPSTLYGAYNLEFFFGIGVAWWLKNRFLPQPRILWMGGVGLFAIAAIAEDLNLVNGYAVGARLLYGIPAAMIVAGVAEANRKELLTIPLPLRLLGKASYSIYLFQVVVIAVVWKLLSIAGMVRAMPGPLLVFLLVGAAVVGGLLMSQFVEYPLMALVRGVVRPSPPIAPQVTRNLRI